MNFLNLKSLVLVGSIALLSGCGGGSSSGSGGGTPTNPPNPQPTPICSTFNPKSLPIANIDNPYSIECNNYKIDFTGATYIQFKTNKEGMVRFAASSLGYSDSRFQLFEHDSRDEIPIEGNGSLAEGYYVNLPAGHYILKVYNDKTPSKGVYFSIISPSFENTQIAVLPFENGIKTNTPPSFRAIWKFLVPKTQCLKIQTSYAIVVTYDNNLAETGLDIDNNTECFDSGTYYIRFANHTVYTQPFELVFVN